MIILISIYSSVYTQQNQIKKSENKNKTKKHLKSINNSCLFKTQSHTIPEVLSSFGNSAYNIKKMKYKERPVLHAYTGGVPYTKSNQPNFDKLSDTENIRMLTEIECVGMMLSKLIHDRQNKTRTSIMIIFKAGLLQMCLFCSFRL